MQTQTHTTTYKNYGPVNVLATEGALSQIETDSGDTFWVKSELLKTKRVKRQNDTAITNLVQPAALPTVHDEIDAGIPNIVVIDEAQHITPAQQERILATPATIDEAADWLQQHVAELTVAFPESARARMERKLLEANGQALYDGMPGTRVQNGKWGISFSAIVNAPVPENLLTLIEVKQKRIGRCKDTPITAERFRVSCNKLGWELLTRGVKLG